MAGFFPLTAVTDPKFVLFFLTPVTDPKFGLFGHVLCFARIMSTLFPNSCRQTARIGGAAAPLPPRPVRLWVGLYFVGRDQTGGTLSVCMDFHSIAHLSLVNPLKPTPLSNAIDE